mmetsp:Transcript_19352/g.28874  ORF Transcript_19352/g.28874 Transcript_19352/m.28874 type:complete len:154 (+) Transcript_19352:158-619(+)
MTSSSPQKSAFSKHTQEQIQQPSTTATTNDENPYGQMSLTARLLVFLLVPSATGLIGLFSSFLQSTRTPPEGQEPHTIDLDRDFMTPFLLGLAFVIVIGFQTGGFRVAGGMTAMERKFALSWPKAKRVRKVRRERVIVEDEDGDLDDDNKKDR